MLLGTKLMRLVVTDQVQQHLLPEEVWRADGEWEEGLGQVQVAGSGVGRGRRCGTRKLSCRRSARGGARSRGVLDYF